MHHVVRPFLCLLLATALSACGGPPSSARRAQHQLATGNYAAAERAADASLAEHPKDATSWRVKIRAAMGRGELERAVDLYRQWKELRGSHDPTAYRLMAMTTVWQGIQVPSAEISARSIHIIEAHEIERLADEVRERLGDDDDLVAAAAAIALLTSHPAAPQIAVDLLRSEDPRARALVLRGIARKVGAHARVDILKGIVDSDASVRRAAVDGIAGWHDSEDAPVLLKLAKSDPDQQVRSRALRALNRTGAKGLQALALAAIDDAYVGVRLAAVAILDKRGDDSVLPTLRSLVESDNLSVALRAAAALHHRDGADMLATVERAYASPNWASRVAAINSAAEAAPRHQALAFAGRAMADARIEVRLAAARMLLSMGVEESPLVALRAALRDPSFDARLTAATDLAHRNDPEAIEVLSRLARSARPEQRQRAIVAHRAAGVVSDGLIAALADESTDVRLAAADVLLGL